MIKYKKIYIEAFGYSEYDFIPSEISGQASVDIHHIWNREDRIENLMAVSREEHLKYGDKKKHMSFLYRKHLEFLESNNIPHDSEFMQNQIIKYQADEKHNNYINN